jgi:hypothetical protein
VREGRTFEENAVVGAISSRSGRMAGVFLRAVTAVLVIPVLLVGGPAAHSEPPDGSSRNPPVDQVAQRSVTTDQSREVLSPENLVQGQWTWVSGSNQPNQLGTYGAQGVAAPGNSPGARFLPISWTDFAGNLWLFGGFGPLGFLNDLWKYNIATGLWTWVSGSNQPNQVGTYGTQGVAAAGNVPGASVPAGSWTDSGGNLWLFGGTFNGSGDWASRSGPRNDLWKFNIATGLWTWISGSNQPNQVGTYGTQGVAAAGNVPGARDGSVPWTDTSGNLWLYGGTG